MSVTAYVGLPGHGKTYQVVSNIVLNSLKEGRRIITNIPLLPDKIDDFLIDAGNAPEDVGDILIVEQSQISENEFFPSKEQIESKESTHQGVIVQPGDIVIIDEAWEHFGTGQNLNCRAFEFLRYHRHNPHPDTGVTSDIVLLSQDIMDISPKVRRVIEMTVLTVKAKELGLDSAYRIEVYERCDLRKRPSSVRQGLYEKKYFELYQSYDVKTRGVKSLEKRVDKRQSIFTTPYFRYVFPMTIVSMAFIIYLTNNYINNIQSDLTTEPEPPPVSRNIYGSPNDTSTTHQNLNYPVPITQNSQNPQFIPQSVDTQLTDSVTNLKPLQTLPESTKHSIIGHYIIGEQTYLLVDLGQHRRRIPIDLQDNDYVQYDDLHLRVIYNNEIITDYTGNFREPNKSSGSFTDNLPTFGSN